MLQIPKIGAKLNKEQLEFLKTLSKSCRRSIIEMTKNSQSGHPGGSLSSLDYLSVLYAFIISQTGAPVVVSNGHISPGVYSILGALKYVNLQKAIKTFRKFGSEFEGHVTRHVPGVVYGTGPLGIGISVATSLALAQKRFATGRAIEDSQFFEDNAIHDFQGFVFVLVGDGECQEGQVHEAINFAKQENLKNLIVFVDYNKVQLTDSLSNIQNIDIKKMFAGADFEILEINGHDYQAIWSALSQATKNSKPTAIIGNTIMGYGIQGMEEDGRAHKATWHGKAPSPEFADQILTKFQQTPNEKALMRNFQTLIKWRPKKTHYPQLLSKVKIHDSKPRLYGANELTDCRSAYGKALADLAHLNRHLLVLTADLKGSVKTEQVANELPQQYIECGIGEQNMLSMAGGLSLKGFLPFVSTFGAFMTSRAKDQARVNDINCTNVKMVATHCGLSVGEDGPTHQAIDDLGSFLGFYNTMLLEAIDPNHTDRLIRYIAKHYGNFYLRMGRHKIPVITKEDGTPFYDEGYKYEYGKTDLLRYGKDFTIIASGPMVTEALKARAILEKKKKTSGKHISIAILAVSSLKKFDQTFDEIVEKTGKILCVEDHNAKNGLASQIALHILEKKLKIKSFTPLATKKYELSGQPEELYASAGIDAEAISKEILKFF